jgi:hypothetical protein
MLFVFRSSGNLQVAGGVSRSRAASETPDREILSGNWKVGNTTFNQKAASETSGREILSGNWKVGKKILMKGVRSS